MNDEEYASRRRSASIKLAKELKPFDLDLGYESLPAYMETLTEDVKQYARDIRRLAKELDLTSKRHAVEPYTVIIDEESAVISALLRRYSSRINKSCVLLYETAYIDFQAHAESKLDAILEEDDATDDE